MTQTVTRQEIENAVTELLRELYPRAWPKDIVFDVDAPLTGQMLHLSGTHLAYLFFAVQERFGIVLNEADVTDRGFLCIRGITDRVAQRLVDHR